MAQEFGSREAYRRQVGLFLGGSLGLVYGAVSQFINSAYLPGINFHLPPFGPWGNLALCILLGAGLGLAAAWSESALIGILASSLLASVFVLVATLLTGPLVGEGMVAKVLSLIFLLFPVFGALAPLMWVFRKASDRLEQHQRERSPWSRRLAWPAALILVLAALGSLSLYRPDARAMLAQYDTLLRASRSGGALPQSLRTEGLADFPARAVGAYTLQWDRDDRNRYLIPRPASSLQTQAVGVARFENGYLLACLFTNPNDSTPRCRDYEPQE